MGIGPDSYSSLNYFTIEQEQGVVAGELETEAVGTCVSSVADFTAITDVGNLTYDICDFIPTSMSGPIGYNIADYLVSAEPGNKVFDTFAAFIEILKRPLNRLGFRTAQKTLVGFKPAQNPTATSGQATALPPLNGLALWLDGSDQSSMTLDGSSGVLTWRDKSGQLNHIGQSTSGFRPVATTSGSVSFDGGDDYLTVESKLFNGTAGAVFIVYETNEPRPVGENIYFINASDSTVANRFILLSPHLSSAADDKLNYLALNADSQDRVRGETSVANNNKSVVGFISDGSSISIRLNGQEESLVVEGGSNTGRWFGDIDNRDNFTVGARRFNSIVDNHFLGDIYSILIYDDIVLSSGQIEEIEDFLNDGIF